MKRRVRAIARYLVDLRSILVAFAIFDFIVICMMASEIRYMCIVSRRYQPLSYLIGPTILLISSLFLSANRWWGNTVALLASGCFIGYFVYALLVDPVMGLSSHWELNQIYFPYFFGVHYVFALIVFCYAAFSLKRNFLSQKVTTPAR
jgi:hypothetical protein